MNDEYEAVPAPLLDSPTELMPLLDRGGRRRGTAGHRGSHLGAVGHGMMVALPAAAVR